jgi:uncharacterized protein (DUF2062 family)
VVPQPPLGARGGGDRALLRADPGAAADAGALLVAVPLRKNIPVALLVTLYTNPLTIVPLYILAYGYGQLLLGMPLGTMPQEPVLWDWANIGASLREFAHWSMALGKPLAIGLVALARDARGGGLLGDGVGWRAYVVLAWRARARSGEK